MKGVLHCIRYASDKRSAAICDSVSRKSSADGMEGASARRDHDHAAAKDRTCGEFRDPLDPSKPAVCSALRKLKLTFSGLSCAAAVSARLHGRRRDVPAAVRPMQHAGLHLRDFRSPLGFHEHCPPPQHHNHVVLGACSFDGNVQAAFNPACDSARLMSSRSASHCS